METARQTALNLLIKAEKGQAYSNLALNAALSQSQLSAQDRSLVTALFYGVLERKITLDYVIQQYSNLKLNKISFDDFEVGEKVIFKWKPGMEDYYAFKTIPVFEMYKFSTKIELTEFTRVKGKILNSDKIWYGSCDYLFEDEKESKYISYVGCNSSSDMTVTWNLQNSQFSDKESYDCYVVEKDNLALFLINNKEVW